MISSVPLQFTQLGKSASDIIFNDMQTWFGRRVSCCRLWKWSVAGWGWEGFVYLSRYAAGQSHYLKTRQDSEGNPVLLKQSPSACS